MKRLQRDQSGFTIIELLLATSFFTFIMILVITGYLQINRQYTRGLTTQEVQNGTRLVVEDITQSIRSAQAAEVTVLDNYLCVGQTQYAFNQVNSTGDGITNVTFAAPNGSEFLQMSKSIIPSGCGVAVDKNGPTHEGLLEEGLLVQYLNVTRIGTTASFEIELVMSTDAREFPGDFSTLGQNATCSVQRGDEFCDVARIKSVVTARN